MSCNPAVLGLPRTQKKELLQPKALSAADFSVPDMSIEIAACIEGISDEILSLIPEEKHRKAIDPYCRDGRLWVRAVAGSPNKKVVEEVWDVDKCSEEGLPEYWRAYPTGLSQAVSALLPKPLVVQAM